MRIILSMNKKRYAIVGTGRCGLGMFALPLIKEMGTMNTEF